jgi:hypothetical protein
MPKPPPDAAEMIRKPGVHGLLYVAKWLLGRGRELWQQNLTPAEREEFKALLAKSRGSRKNLAGDDVARLSRLVVKALVGKDGLDVGDVISIASRIRTRR